MDNQNTSREDRPNEGKHPSEPHHRRGGKNRSYNRPRNRSAEMEAEVGAATETSSVSPVPQPTAGQKKQGPGTPRGRHDNRDAHESRENRDNRENRENRDNRAAQETTERRHPATGRPRRTAHHAPEAELPDMNALLIEDGAPMTARTDDATDSAAVERILASDPFARPIEEPIPDDLPEGKVVIVGVRFRTGGKTYFFDPGERTYQAGEYAIVETARGLEFGEICMGNRLLDESMVVPPLRPVVRAATDEDIAHNRENHEREEEAFRIGIQKIREHKLDMKLVAVQYTFDNAKLLFYFTSAKRVDFRELVKDLAGIFHLRIELRQIGIRDEARMIGGLGPCGRPLCCTSFLTDFGQVSMKMAKEQNLSLNSTKISGCCGRLMCCLRYEHEAYLEEMRRSPSVGSFVNTPEGPGVVTEVFLMKGEVKVSLRSQPDSAPKKFLRDEVEVQVRDRHSHEPLTTEAAPSESADETDDNPVGETEV